jgi:hypothetical protein
VSSGNLITRNRFYNTRASALLVMGDGAWGWNGNTFSHNILWNAGDPLGDPEGISDDGYAVLIDQGPNASTTNYIAHNTIVGSAGARDFIFVYQGAAQFLSIENNILSGFSRTSIFLGLSVTDYASDYDLFNVNGMYYYNNYWQTLGYIRSNAGWETHGSIADPLFTNASAGDFTIPINSPAYHSGVYIPGVSTANPPNIGAK